MPRSRRPAVPLGAALLLAALASTACSNLIPMAGDGGPVPLDEARAVALARQKVCGAPGSATDRDCTVRAHEQAGGVHRVVIDRGPAAGGGADGDRVRVVLRDHGMRVEVQPLPRDP